ncbi:MAG TPA: hypothetical protein VG757_15530 [Devosia sp.]|nr:hypothetical protein [Devosia sp.]
MADKPYAQRFFEMLMESQYWPEARMQAHQRAQLSQLLRDARSKVPFYATRLDVLFRPDGSIDWDRWTDVPIVKRTDLSVHGEAMLDPGLNGAHGQTIVATTSGSTGAPVEIVSTQLTQSALRANRFRAYRWHGIDWSKISCQIFGEEADDAPWPEGSVLGPWGPPWDPASIWGRIIKINRMTPYEKIVEFIARKQPSYLATGPKTALAVALEAERLGARIHIDALLAQGAMVGDLEHETLRRVFGAKIAELYSSKEAGQIAHGCPEQPGLHVNAESVLVEIIDEAGQPCGIGQPGRLIVTPFLNAAQPLIRYEQGDVAEWMAPCPCGRCLPRLGGLIGRTTGLFYHPDGRVRAGFLHPNDRAILKCREWQIAQTGPHQFEVRYVPADWNVPGDEAQMADRIRTLYFDDAEVAFRRARALPSRAGKTIEYVNEWLPPERVH